MEEQAGFDLHFSCSQCEASFPINAENCAAHIFFKQMYFSYIEVECPNCDHEVSLFCTREILGRFIAAKVSLVQEDYAPDSVVKGYEELYGLSLPDSKELTWRHVQLLRYAHWELEQDLETIWKELEGD